MKKLQLIRTLVQVLFLVITVLTFITDFKVFMLIVLVSTLIGGVFFCGWVCPFGFLQDLVARIRRLLTKKKFAVPNPIHKYLIYMRYVFLIGTLAGATFYLVIDARVSFLTLIKGDIISTIAYAAFSGFLLVTLFMDRPFCNYFCFQGAKYSLFGSVRFLSIKRDENICIDCKICENVCPMNVKLTSKKNVRSLQCINCFECISNCPKKGVLKYGYLDKDYLPKIFKK